MSGEETGSPDAAERLTREELTALQLARLRATLRHAYDHVALYRRKFDAAGVGPDDCRTLADLARFPFTTKADLRDTYPFGMFAVPMAEVRRVHASSGTTGRPTVVGYTENDLSMLGRRGRPLDPRRRRPPRRTRSMSPTGTACSPAASARTTEPSARAVRSSPPPAA